MLLDEEEDNYKDGSTSFINNFQLKPLKITINDQMEENPFSLGNLLDDNEKDILIGSMDIEDNIDLQAVREEALLIEQK